MNSCIACITYRRLEPLRSLLASIETHCPSYPLAVFEDCATYDGTAAFLMRGAVPLGYDAELDSDGYEHTTGTGRKWTAWLARRNEGVAGQSNKAIRWMERNKFDHLCLCNDDLLAQGDFPAAYAAAHAKLGVGLLTFCDLKNTAHATYEGPVVPMKGLRVKILPRMVGLMMSITGKLVETIGYFDATFGRFGNEHSLLPGTKLLMRNHSWKNVEDVREGDEVIGIGKQEGFCKKYAGNRKVYKDGQKPQFNASRLVPAMVLKTHVHEDECVRVGLESGEEIVCTADHEWLDPLFHAKAADRARANLPLYIPATVGRSLSRIYPEYTPCEMDDGYKHGYVDGAMCGDGTLSQKQGSLRVTDDDFNERFIAFCKDLEIPTRVGKISYPVKTTGEVYTGEYRECNRVGLSAKTARDMMTWGYPVTDSEMRGWIGGMYDAEGSGYCIAQDRDINPENCAEIARILTHFNFKFKQSRKEFKLAGGRYELMRFMNTFTPACSYKMDRFLVDTRMFIKRDRIVSVEPIGKRIVHCITTTMGNFIANGYVSRNCDFNNRARLQGFISVGNQSQLALDIETTTLASQPLPSTIMNVERPALDARANQDINRVDQLYRFESLYRPYRLPHPRYAHAFGMPTSGIPGHDLDNLGYTFVSDRLA